MRDGFQGRWFAGTSRTGCCSYRGVLLLQGGAGLLWELHPVRDGFQEAVVCRHIAHGVRLLQGDLSSKYLMPLITQFPLYVGWSARKYN